MADNRNGVYIQVYYEDHLSVTESSRKRVCFLSCQLASACWGAVLVHSNPSDKHMYRMNAQADVSNVTFLPQYCISCMLGAYVEKLTQNTLQPPHYHFELLSAVVT